MIETQEAMAECSNCKRITTFKQVSPILWRCENCGRGIFRLFGLTEEERNKIFAEKRKCAVCEKETKDWSTIIVQDHYSVAEEVLKVWKVTLCFDCVLDFRSKESQIAAIEGYATILAEDDIEVLMASKGFDWDKWERDSGTRNHELHRP